MWTDAMVSLCKKLAKEGCSASQISSALGTKSRNAVIGKLYRCGQNVFGGKKMTQKFAFDSTKRIVSVKYADLSPQKIDVRREDGLTFQELGPHNCHWPFGDKDVYFCGRTKLPRLSYCLEHEYLSRRHPK